MRTWEQVSSWSTMTLAAECDRTPAIGAGGVSVVGEAADELSALERMRELQPAIALVDVHLPDIDGMQVASRLSRFGNPPLVILMSSYDSTDLQPLIAESGARGFVPKDELSREAIEGLLR